METKRKEYTSWDGYFMGIAAEASFRSKDPSTQNGSCFVDPVNNIPLIQGYNGLPRGCSDDEYPWARTADKKYDTKYPYCEHSERNAIYCAARKGIALEGSVLYLYSEKGYYPCDECARAIIQSGVQKVVMAFAIKEPTDKYSWDETLRMFKDANVELVVLSNYEADRKIMIKDFKLMAKKMNEIVVKLEEGI